MILGEGVDIVVVPPGPSFTTVAAPAAPPVLVFPVAGPAGAQGPPGIGSPLTFTGTWSSFSAAHTFTYLPPVRLVDATGEEVEIGVEYPDPTHVAITFPTPFTGTIIIG